MGKNLKGKDCGKGIYQRKDGLYSARFVDKTGKGMRNIFRLFPKQGIGWKKRNMPTSTKKFLLPPKQRLTNGLVSGLKI